MTYKRKKTLCENCLSEFNFIQEDVYWRRDEFDDGEYVFYLVCPFCGSDNELFSLEEFGINEYEITEDQSKDWEAY